MDKNDFDIDFDFEKDLGFDPEEFLDSDNPGDFDMSQFDDEEPTASEENGENPGQEDFQDFDLDQEKLENYDLDEEELAQEDEFDPYAAEDVPQPDEDADYTEGDDFGEDLYFPRREHQEDDYQPEDGAQEYQESAYDEQGEPYYAQEPVEEPSTREDRKKLKLPKIKLPAAKKKNPERARKPRKPSVFSKFLDWYMEPINRRKNPEPETVGEDGRRRRRKRPTKIQIFKEAYLPVIIAGVSLILIVSFVSGALTNAFKNKKIKDEKDQQASIAASQEADQAAQAYQELLAQAELKATEYDYAGAIEVLDSYTGGTEELQTELNAKRAAYMNEQSKLVEWKDVNAIPNLSFHVLMQDPVRAFADKENGGQYNRNFVTTEEFSKILNQLYNNGYVLVDLKHFVASNVDLTGSMNFAYDSIYLPEGKKPVMITETMVNYFEYMVDGNKDGEPDAMGAGFANKLVLDGNGDIKASYVDMNNQTLVGDYDLVPILESFIKEHPDFAYKGSRAILAVSGSQGVFGYRTDSSYVASKGADYQQAQIAEAKVVVDALREKGYTIACYSYANKDYRQLSVNEIRTDIQNFTSQAIPVLGEVDTIVFARGTDIDDYSGNKFSVLYDAGYRYFVGATTSSEIKTDINITYVHQTRLMVTGNALAWHSNLFTNYFDCNVVLDVANRGNVPN